jgi:hypothetical protein
MPDRTPSWHVACDLMALPAAYGVNCSRWCHLALHCNTRCSKAVAATTTGAVQTFVFHLSRKRSVRDIGANPASGSSASGATGGTNNDATVGGGGAAFSALPPTTTSTSTTSDGVSPPSKKVKPTLDLEAHLHCTICMSLYHKHGARVSTEGSARGCHWYPRLLA